MKFLRRQFLQLALSAAVMPARVAPRDGARPIIRRGRCTLSSATPPAASATFWRG